VNYVIHESKIEAKTLPGRLHKMIVGPGDGMLHCSSMSGGVAWFPPESHAPPHVHQNAEEVLYVLSGHGAFFFDGRPEAITVGDFIRVPEGVEHSIRNDAQESMKLLYIFTPPVVQGSYDNVDRPSGL